MKALDLVGSAIGNTFRSKTRTILTILAIFVGAFTLTITNGLGTGINRYIDDTVAAIGAEDVMTVTKVAENATDRRRRPTRVRPRRGRRRPRARPSGEHEHRRADRRHAARRARRHGRRRARAARQVDRRGLHRARRRHPLRDRHRRVHHRACACSSPRASSPTRRHPEYQVVIPDSYVDALGFADAEAAIGQPVTVAVTDAERVQHELEATVVGRVGGEPRHERRGGAERRAHRRALRRAVDGPRRRPSRTRSPRRRVWYDPDATPEAVTALQDRLTDAGYDSTDRRGAARLVQGRDRRHRARAQRVRRHRAARRELRHREHPADVGAGAHPRDRPHEGHGNGQRQGVRAVQPRGGVHRIPRERHRRRRRDRRRHRRELGALGRAARRTCRGSRSSRSTRCRSRRSSSWSWAIAFLAGTLPAARAARPDPVESLRYE